MRKDGSKAVRIVRKKRVLISEKEKKNHARRHFLMGIFLTLICVASFLIYFVWNLYRLSSSQSYDELAEQLRETWGAQSVEFKGVTVTGFDIDIKEISIIFPQSGTSMIQSATLHKISSSLQQEGVFTGDYVFEEVKVGSINMTLREGVDQMKLNLQDINDLVNIRRIVSPDFNLQVLSSDPAKPNIAVSKSEIYLRYTNESNEDYSLSLDGGKVTIRGWKEFSLDNARLLITADGIEELRAELSMTEQYANTAGKQDLTPTLYLSGDISSGSSIYGPYAMDSKNMQLSDFTDARLISFLTAKTRANRIDGNNIMTAQLRFSPQGTLPSFRGEYLLQDIKWKAFPAQQTIMRHLPADRRAQYVQLAIAQAKLQLDSSPDRIRLQFSGSDMSENYSITLKGDIIVDDVQALSGSLDYGIPSALTRSEYPDGISDPIFKEIGELAWLSTTLSGTAFAPRDTSGAQDLAAAEARKSRPKPFSLDSIDFKKISNDLERLQEIENQASNPQATPTITPTAPASSPQAPARPQGQSASSSTLF